jgi:uncharacterized protein (UPF0262 family)
MASASLEDLRIDEALWSAGTAERKHEWRLAISEIVQEGSFDLPDGLPPGAIRGEVLLRPGRVVLELRSEGGPPTSHEVPLTELEPLIEEYMQTIREMSKLGVSANSPRLEALDIAKRLTHDEAGELIVRHLARLRPDHATARRVFTLLVTLFHDTTKLAAPPHRVMY